MTDGEEVRENVELRLDDGLRDVLPRLSPEARAELERSIREEGRCHAPLVAASHGTLLATIRRARRMASALLPQARTRTFL